MFFMEVDKNKIINKNQHKVVLIEAIKKCRKDISNNEKELRKEKRIINFKEHFNYIMLDLICTYLEQHAYSDIDNFTRNYEIDKYQYAIADSLFDFGEKYRIIFFSIFDKRTRNTIVPGELVLKYNGDSISYSINNFDIYNYLDDMNGVFEYYDDIIMNYLKE